MAGDESARPRLVCPSAHACLRDLRELKRGWQQVGDILLQLVQTIRARAQQPSRQRIKRVELPDPLADGVMQSAQLGRVFERGTTSAVGSHLGAATFDVFAGLRARRVQTNGYA